MSICTKSFLLLHGRKGYLNAGQTVSIYVYFLSLFCWYIRSPQTSKSFTFCHANLYPSSYEEWQPVQSIVGLINCVHAFVGEQQYKGRRHGDLAKLGIFFYDYYYLVSPSLENCTLHKVPLPSFLSIEWPLPCSNISESFRCKLFHEVQKGLKPNNRARYVTVKVNMPIEEFVDFFACCPISSKNTMLVCRNMDQETILQFLDEGWNRKHSNSILCEVDPGSVFAKYMIKSQNFIVSFFYRWFHFVHGAQVSLAIGEQKQNGEMVDDDIYVNNESRLSFLLERIALCHSYVPT